MDAMALGILMLSAKTGVHPFTVASAPLAVAAHFRAIEQARITALHQQADTEHWHGQIFKRLEEA